MRFTTPLTKEFYAVLPRYWAPICLAAQMVSSLKYYIAFYPEYRNSPETGDDLTPIPGGKKP
jgi:hypothetical protein